MGSTSPGVIGTRLGMELVGIVDQHRLCDIGKIFAIQNLMGSIGPPQIEEVDTFLNFHIRRRLEFSIRAG